MGYLITTASTKQTATVRQVEVPEELAKELAELWGHLSEHPSEVAVVTFDTAEEVKSFEAQVKSWALYTMNGEVRYRKSPARDLPENVIRFRLTATKAEEADAGTPENPEGTENTAPEATPEAPPRNRRK